MNPVTTKNTATTNLEGQGAPPPAAPLPEPASLLPAPAVASGDFALDLALLWVKGLKEDSEAARAQGLAEEAVMMREGRQRVAAMRAAAREARTSSYFEALGGVAAGAMGMVGGAYKVPREGKCDTGGAFKAAGQVMDALTAFNSGAATKRSGDADATAADHESQANIAGKRAERAWADKSDAASEIERAIALIESLLRAQNAAEQAAVRG